MEGVREEVGYTEAWISDFVFKNILNARVSPDVSGLSCGVHRGLAGATPHRDCEKQVRTLCEKTQANKLCRYLRRDHYV